jgi:hypothetical protein
MISPYKYAGLPLTPLMAQELILELFTGQTVHKQEMTDIVEAAHLERGGNPPRSKQNPITRALTLLKEIGLAENPMQGVWFFPSNIANGVDNTLQHQKLN